MPTYGATQFHTQTKEMQKYQHIVSNCGLSQQSISQIEYIFSFALQYVNEDLHISISSWLIYVYLKCKQNINIDLSACTAKPPTAFNPFNYLTFSIIIHVLDYFWNLKTKRFW